MSTKKILVGLVAAVALMAVVLLTAPAQAGINGLLHITNTDDDCVHVYYECDHGTYLVGYVRSGDCVAFGICDHCRSFKLTARNHRGHLVEVEREHGQFVQYSWKVR